MSACQIVAAPAPTPLDIACVRLNQWRGQMVENFARSEQAVTEALSQIATTAPHGKRAKFPHLVGQRYERLAGLLDSDAASRGHAAAALCALRDFREHDTLRTMLCHGVSRIAVDRRGEWVAVMTMTNLRGGAVTTDRMTMLESEGRALLDQVIASRRRVCAALGQVRRQTYRSV